MAKVTEAGASARMLETPGEFYFGAYHRLTTMKKEHGVLEQKVKRLIKYFHSSFKLKGDLGNAETMALVKDHLQKQNSNRLPFGESARCGRGSTGSTLGTLEFNQHNLSFFLWKATLLLDMSSLKCGIYPSEILPSQLKVQISGEQTGALLSSQILNAIQSVKAGYHSTIIDLCRSVSKVVQAST
ncbi:hypothetical protein ACLOJK_041669 [Asimina triloba]